MITCMFEDGGNARLRHMTVTGIIDRHNSVLLIRRAPHLIQPNMWALPGGFVERDETVDYAVKREVAEETGYEATHASLLLINSRPDRPREDRQNVDFSFIVTVGEKTGKPDTEVSDMKWFTFSEIPSPEDIAFDHSMIIQRYIEFRKKAYTIPVLL